MFCVRIDSRYDAASGVVGIIQSVQHTGRTCTIKWTKPDPETGFVLDVKSNFHRDRALLISGCGLWELAAPLQVVAAVYKQPISSCCSAAL